MEIIAFWLWLQQGNGQVHYLQHIYSLGDNHFRAIVSSAKRFLEVLHFAFDGSEARSIPRSDFQNQAVEGISLYLNTICYEALEDLRERIEMNFVRNQMAYLHQEAYGQSRTDRVPAASSMTDLYQEAYGESSHEQIPNILMTDLYQEAYGESSHEQIPNISMTDLYQEAYGESSHEQIPNISMTDLYQETYGESSHEQIPNSSKHLLTKIKALYANTPKHHGEGTSSRNIHVQTSQMHHGECSSSRNIHAQTSHVLRHDYQSTSRLAALLDKLSLRENHNDAITQQLSDIPPDERTLFVTFSNGYPLTKDELHDFFMRYAYRFRFYYIGTIKTVVKSTYTERHYGDIEEITVEEPIESRPPLYAHVTFYSQMTLFRVLDGNRRVKFMTRGKHLWARQYVPKKKKTGV
uniref:RRM domain-containing protein n=1 Tax=Aegilops tauschii TaxID=37682 RepID=R7W065_AEGTA